MEKRAGVGRQITLPLSKAIEISAKSLKTRLGRSIITMGGIVLAIAFLTAILTSQAINSSLSEKGSPELKAMLQGVTGGEVRARQIWLVSLSLLVCVVGITNAMLMSVTERYREIGTMKCLGALNIFIVKLFLLESAFQGLLGSFMGVMIGGAGMLLVSLMNYGGEVITFFPFFTVMRAALFVTAIGVVLSVVGAVYPAYQAARMVPADAMRTEV